MFEKLAHCTDIGFKADNEQIENQGDCRSEIKVRQ